MTIRKRLILSNLIVILIPGISIFLVDSILGFLFFYVLNEKPIGETFIRLRIILATSIHLLTNGCLVIYVSQSILKPIKKLSIAAKRISEGDFEFQIDSNQKDELGELSRTFDTMRVKLKESKMNQIRYEKNRQELIASISHDLKTPLTSIKGYIKGIQDGVANTPEKLKRYTNIIEKTVNEMNGLIDELFLYSKLDLQKVPFHFEDVNLYSFFSDFIEELSFHLEKENGTATLLADPNQSYVVKADRDKLKRVVSNIIQNSLKYTDKDNKKVQVQLISQSDTVIVKISDNGRGIQKKDLPFIFESFYRPDPSRNRSSGGSGLGLSIAKKIIEAHGGTIWAESEWEKGTTIYFTLKKVIQ